ncbi:MULTISPECIES: hypothetical protein [Methylobacter]
MHFIFSLVGRNKLVRATARTGVSGKHHPDSPETPPRAMRLDGLIPAYAIAPMPPRLSYPSINFVSFPTNKTLTNFNNFNAIQNGTTIALAKTNNAIGQADEIN